MTDYMKDLEVEVEIESKIPEPEDFFLKTHLYKGFSIDRTNLNDVDRIIELEFFNDAIHCFCPQCKQDRTFRNDTLKNKTLYSDTKPHVMEQLVLGTVTKDLIHPYEVNHYLLEKERGDYVEKERTFTLEFYCTHTQSHRIYFTFTVQNKKIQKSGQFPSLLDLENNLDLKKYKKELGVEKGREFHKAIGLASSGTGIGSYVYLRRIFEGFIFQAKDEAVKGGDFTADDFKGKKMDECIGMLSTKYLPDILVQNKKYYGIVSIGIHELSEEKCLDYFNLLKNGIQVILDEKIRAKEEEAKKEEFSKGISKALKEIYH